MAGNEIRVRHQLHQLERAIMVHMQHGIGRYLGMKVMPLSGAKEGADNKGRAI